jgi:hypothetical protein
VPAQEAAARTAVPPQGLQNAVVVGHIDLGVVLVEGAHRPSVVVVVVVVVAAVVLVVCHSWLVPHMERGVNGNLVDYSVSESA